ncbi:hypothetical protein MTR67_035672 [Solanum verrucosum]|uniref:DUF4283 domain-containing protein n=1 Tax=Solanum verrucosum TaxID=315347 RepID=A0AAF0TY27_SOLVR|nr:hypothetical protein MTR67_029904 [Solanum verrucosum]WMV42287.1 hypothetical protein MTR67_035672 [Solanum verrucosum]
MDNRVYFRSGGKSYDITESRSKAEVWYDWVEDARHHMRRMVLSRGALGWVCKRLTEASGIRGKAAKSWRCRDFSTNFFIALKFNQYGRYLSLISVKGSDRAVIILPESAFNEGWGKLAKKIEAFINRGIKQTKAFKLSGEADYAANKGGRSYRDVLQKSKWTRIETELAEEGSMLQARVQLEDEDLLARCLVGKFFGEDDTPTRNDVRRWAQQTWNGAHGVQVYDMNGILFLFEFQSSKAAEHVLMGDWRRQGSRLKLQWWSPTIGAFPITHEFEWFWIRVLGLPLHLWSRPIMKEIGDRCGGWIETEEETDLKNHLRWARIRVKGPAKKIPASIEIADEENIFSLPIWVESPVTFRKKYDEGACTSKERDEGGYRGRNPSDLSRCRDIHRSEKLPVKPNREEKVFFGERSHVGEKVIKGATSKQIEGHLVLNPGPSHLGMLKAQFSKDCPTEPEPFICDVNRWEKNHEIIYSSTDQNLMEETKVKDSISNYIQSKVNTQVNAEESPQISEELNEEEAELYGQNSSKQITILGDPTPIQCDASECSKEVEGKATEWVQKNLLRLSKEFGVAFEGCTEEAFNLLLKIDQRRLKELTKIDPISGTCENQMVPKEVRNLIFDVNYKDKESRSATRSRGRNATSHLS